MVMGKMRKALKRGLTITLAATVMATSVPQFSMPILAQEAAEVLVVDETSGIETEETVEETTGEMETETVVEEGSSEEETTTAVEEESSVVETTVGEETTVTGDEEEKETVVTVDEKDNLSAPSFADATLVFVAGTDATWKDSVFASNDAKNNIDKATIPDITLGTKAKLTATITVDGDVSALTGEENAIQLASALKTGDDWVYVKSNDYPWLQAGDLQTGKAEVSFIFEEVTEGALQEIIFQYNAVGYTGNITISDVSVETVEEDKNTVSTETEVWSAGEDVKLTIAAGETPTWDDLTYASDITDAVVGAKVKMTAVVTLDGTTTGLDGAEAEDKSYNAIQLAGAIKTGADWTYCKSGDYPFLKADSFTDGKAEVSFSIEDVTAGDLKAIVFQYNSNASYTGNIIISDVKVYNVEEKEVELEEKDPTILSDLATEEDYNRWTTETGWDYYHGGAENASPVLSYDSENQRLKVALDYSANASTTWSEAKAKYVLAEAADVSQYNQLSVDFIYPDALDGTKMKFFADGIINKDAAVDESTAEDLGNGMKKVKVTMAFSPSDTPLESVTIGIIGVSTSFVGDVYLDNLVLSQKNAMEDYVEITAVPGAGSVAKLVNKPESIKVTDANADDSAKALFAYLQTLSNDDQVLFGHQNDMSRSVNASAAKGDVYDVTGQVSGLFGIDTLALTGSEAGGTDAASALANSVAYSKAAAQEGAIVTLSAHMPNVSNSKVIKNEDGSYDFFQCDFSESKDLSNDIAKKILPGGEYNVVYKAYLDIIVDYAKQLQEENIPIIFRPLHENTGNWFWWGSSNTAETYKSLFRYTKDYIEGQGVHNMLWVYSPNGPLTTETAYLSYYPGDEYVDILAFDYYDDYNTYPATSDGSFFEHLDDTCAVVSGLAAERGKIAAISETGVRVMKKDGSDNEGLLVKGNPIGTAASGTNWYSKINEIAQKNNMPYYLVWANFGDTNFYVPYKYNDTYGHELINDFIDFYNEDSSVFGADADFYENMESLVVPTNTFTNQMGYMVSPFDMDTVLEATQVKAVVKNAEAVQFVIDNTATDASVIVDAQKVADGSVNSADLWSAELTDAVMAQVGKTEVAAITLKADGVLLAKITNIAMGKEKEKAPANVLENFDYYSGSDGLLDATYSANSAAGCGSSFVLDTENKVDGTYGGAFKYQLKTASSEVWTGRIKSDLVSGDFSAYNAVEMWVKPDGKGQKLVVQLTDASGEEFEVYLTDFVGTENAKYVTIPFDSFKGKRNGKLDTANITKFAVWCNSIIPEGHEGAWEVDSTIYFDGIQAVNIKAGYQTDKNGLLISDESLAVDAASATGMIVSDGASTVKEAVMLDYAQASKTWKEAAKTVYVNDRKVASKYVKEVKTEDGDITGLNIDGNVFKNAGAYSIYVVAKNYEATNTIRKNVYGTDGNRIFNGTMDSEDYWTVYDEDEITLSNGTIAGGRYTLDYKSGKKAEDNWVVEASSLKQSGISVEAGKAYELRFKANTDMSTGRDIIVETNSGVDGAVVRSTVQVASATATYDVEIMANTTTDDMYVNFLVGPVGAGLQIEDQTNVAHTMMLDSIQLYEADAAPAMPGEKPENGGLWIKNIPDQTYTGSAIKPAIEVYEGDTLLGKKDYTVSYKNNKNAGTATVTVKGKGNYTGSDTTTFEILKKDIADEDITAADVYAVIDARKGTVKNPKVTVKYGKITLKAETTKKANDYSLTYDKVTGEDNKAIAGSYKVVITGNGNYKGTKTIKYDVLKSDILLMSKAKISFASGSIKAIDYANQNEKPSYTVKIGSTTLVENEDYKVVYPENLVVGKNTVTFVPLKDSIYGTKTYTVTVTGAKITAGNIKIETPEVLKFPYTGSPVEFGENGIAPIVVTKTTVTEGSEQPVIDTLVEGVDYELVYSKQHTNAGKASVTVVGKGGYTDKKVIKYTIEKVDMSDAANNVTVELGAESVVYNKKGATVPVVVKYKGNVVDPKFYKVTYKNYKVVSTEEKPATVTITGKTNFKNSLAPVTYKVVKSDASQITFTAAEALIPSSKDPKKVKTSLTIKETATNKALKSKADYLKAIEYKIADNTAEGGYRDITEEDLVYNTEVTAIITLTGNYGDGATTKMYAPFRLYKTKASSFKVAKIDPQVYAGGEELRPSLDGKVTIKVKVKEGNKTVTKTETLVENEDYTVSYTKNTAVGTAKVTITGINEYGGTKSATFKITKKKMDFVGVMSFFEELFN